MAHQLLPAIHDRILFFIYDFMCINKLVEMIWGICHVSNQKNTFGNHTSARAWHDQLIDQIKPLVYPR